MMEGSWPQEALSTAVREDRQRTDGSVRCVAVGICDEGHTRTRQFCQGSRAHVFVECEVQEDLEVPGVGIELIDDRGIVVYGKSTFQTRTPVPLRATRGSVLRFHHWIDLDLSPGTYHIGCGVADTDPGSYKEYTDGTMTYATFSGRVRERCRVLSAGAVEVQYRLDGKLPFHGLTNLNGGNAVRLVEATFAPSRGDRPPPARPAMSEWPTVFHLTHWKAGSQWIRKILAGVANGRVVPPAADQAQVRHHALQPGHVYPTVYLSKNCLDKIALPSNSRLFVVIRDLRDTLVSAYFSFRVSHPIIDDTTLRVRQRLLDLDFEAGMLYLMNGFLAECADIQLSWLESDALILRYEDLLSRDVELLQHALIEHCGLPVGRERLRAIVEVNRFAAVTGGRSPGQEDVSAHERKGVAGEWRVHFTDRLRQAFKARFGGLLVSSGYERDLDW
jgi:Wzt C-terminal domain/Sulfotransferase domain